MSWCRYFRRKNCHRLISNKFGDLMSIVPPPELVGDVAVAKLADLCARQIRAAMDEERKEISGLSQHLLSAHTYAGNAKNQADQQEMLKELGLAMSKLQFADRLSQRLLNIVNNLNLLRDFLSEADSDIEQQNWQKMLEEVGRSFSMETERQLFDEIIGATGADTASEEHSRDEKVLPELF